ncbi:uncharacterized protein LOC119409649 [Nematolebias whitei]|uniref:uncharacterized protein LOC119409649 n=1 Tax=Nematolebias whitei TaxID=451745 RepID=UPI0018994DF3|nr:uncharacterized protein LOC119409649 [Nematolebias whitei]
MRLYDEKILWSFMLLLAGAAGQNTQYLIGSTCAFGGSTVTLPCSFTPSSYFIEGGQKIPLKIVRVVWCKNHLICHGSTPSVYDSNLTTNDPRYEYLGDKQRNCTLQIKSVASSDDATFRFRMEANNSEGHFTNQTGVNVMVVGGTQMRIMSSSGVTEFRSGQSVSLQCRSVCSFYHLEITWMRDGHALSETGPALQLSSLTTKDSGNYTCALKTNIGTQSVPIRLQVEEGPPLDLFLILGAVFGFLLVLIILVLVFILIKRKRAAAAAGHQTELREDMHSNFLPAEDAGQQRTESSQEDGDVSYASVQFRHKKHKRQVEEAADSIIYSSVATKR